MAQQVNAASYIRPASRAFDPGLDLLPRQGSLVIPTEHARTPQVTMLAEGGRQPGRQRDVPDASTLRTGHLAVPIRTPNAQLPFGEIDVRPFERDHLAAPPGRQPLMLGLLRAIDTEHAMAMAIALGICLVPHGSKEKPCRVQQIDQVRLACQPSREPGLQRRVKSSDAEAPVAVLLLLPGASAGPPTAGAAGSVR